MRTPVHGLLAMLLAVGTARAAVPEAEMNLRLAAPIRSWDEAIPLGNGRIGGLLWGEGSTLRLSLDRGDLWDERPAKGMDWGSFTYANLVKLVQAKDQQAILKQFEPIYQDVHPTKLPGGRLVIDLDPAQKVESFELDLARAEGRAHLGGGQAVRAVVSAAEPIALLSLPGPAPRGISLWTPAMVARGGAQSAGPDSHGVGRLGYAEAVFGKEDGIQWYEQPAALGLRYVVAVGQRRVQDATLCAVAVTSTSDGADPVAIAKGRIASALDRGWEAIAAPHHAWWKRYWATSQVSIPEPHIARQYHVVRYFYGAASRRGAVPMPLQGLWTADNGSLPPWKGDYHNDLNTQMTYMGYQAAGHFDEGACYLDFLWDRLPRFQRFAREFYQTKGAAAPGVMTLAGEPLGGWAMYSLSPTMSAWSAHLFYLHWRYTMDDKFLRERAWPWCREVGVCMEGLLKDGPDGRLLLPVSSSPEIFDNSLRAWLKPNSNYDLMSLRMLFLALQEMADAVGEPAAAWHWAALAARLGPYHVRNDGTLKLNAVEDLPGSHRHLSNLMALHPFNLLTCEGSEDDRRIIDASLAEWDRFGPAGWCGYSYSWMAALRARVGRAEEALRHLDVFCRAFILRNGFHVNGDQTKSGFSGFTYRPFTLEGNFLAMHAVHEMLLQSWSPTPGIRDTEVLRIFPATPWRWHDAAFADLRAEGGHTVSAIRKNNATEWIRIVAGRAGTLRVRDNFGAANPVWKGAAMRKDGTDYVATVKRGQVIEASLPVPDAPPPSPANAAVPVEIPKPK